MSFVAIGPDARLGRHTVQEPTVLAHPDASFAMQFSNTDAVSGTVTIILPSAIRSAVVVALSEGCLSILILALRGSHSP